MAPVRGDGRHLGHAVPVHSRRGQAPLAAGGRVRAHVARRCRPRDHRGARGRDPARARAVEAGARVRHHRDGDPVAAVDQRREEAAVGPDRPAGRVRAARGHVHCVPAR